MKVPLVTAVMLLNILSFQTIEAESFVTNPIIFGDFIKIGAAEIDKVYEELPLKKLKQVLEDVSYILRMEQMTRQSVHSFDATASHHE